METSETNTYLFQEYHYYQQRFKKIPIPFKRTQFPIRLRFAMTINKAQGQTLDYVCIYLHEPFFSHG